MQETIIHNINIIRQCIKNACLASNRNENEVELMLVTKTVDAENIRFALNHGEILIGENKVQELKQKYDDLKDIPHQAHLIGHLQSNKIKDVLKYVSCIQSVDGLELAQKINAQLEKEDRTLDILVQVNSSFEESKFGAEPEQVLELVKEISNLKFLKIKGLMTIGIFSDDQEKVRACFKIMKKLQSQIIDLNIPNVEMKTLSMGMSGDLEMAIEEGSTMIRVGTAIFGARQYLKNEF